MAAPIPPAPAASGWTRFWFKASDPTTLGLMRIVAGLLVLYVHLAYTFDLRAFFGPDAWYDQEHANRARHEHPYSVPPLWDYEPFPQFPLRLPDAPHRREAVLEFLRKLPDSPAERREQLRWFLTTIPNNPGGAGQGLVFVRKQVLAREKREERWNAFLNDPYNPADQEPQVPEFVLRVPRDERPGLREEVERFMAYLTRDAEIRTGGGLVAGAALAQVQRWTLDTPKAREDLGYVIDFLVEMAPDDRTRFRRYLVGSKENDPFMLPQDRAERERILAYLDRWTLDPRFVYAKGHPIWSAWFHISSPAARWTFHGFAIAVIALFTIGFCTRVTSVLTWLVAVSYIQRSHHVLFGMDTMMNILLVYLMIGNCGAALSVDRLIQRWRVTRNALRKGPKPDAAAEALIRAPAPSVSAGFVLTMIQIHFCFIYAASGLAKLKGSTWWSHYAIWGTVANPEFSPIHHQIFQDMLEWLAQYQPLLMIFLGFGAVFTLVIEISLPFLIWTKLRPWVIVGAVLLHAGIGMVMGLIVFSLFMMTLLLAFFPSAVVRERTSFTPGKERLTIRFSRAERRQASRAAWIRAVDLTDQVDLQDVEGLETVQVVKSDGKVLTGVDAFAALKAGLPLLSTFGPLTLVPGFAALGRWWLVGSGGTPPSTPRARDKAAVAAR